MRSLYACLLITSFILHPQISSAQGLSDDQLALWTRYILDLEERVARQGDDRELFLRLVDA